MGDRFKGVLRQSGVIPLLKNKVVLITSRKSERWIIPKGYLEKGLSAPDSAAKEAYEEAGLIGTVDHEEVGQYRYRKFGKLFAVELYPLFVETMLDEWDEMHLRRRTLVTPEEALAMISQPELRQVLAAFFAHHQSVNGG